MAKYLTLDDFDVKDKVVLVRVDFNSEVDPETKKVTSDVRIRAHGETTITELAEKGAKVVVLAHQGRKGEPDFIPIKQHAEILGKILKCPVQFVDDVYGEKAKSAIKNLKSSEILVLDNVRGFDGETKKGTPEEHAKTELVQNLAPLADLFVNDAFAAAHRAHVSMVGFTAKLPSAAGRIMERELKSLWPSTRCFGGGSATPGSWLPRGRLPPHSLDEPLVLEGVEQQLAPCPDQLVDALVAEPEARRDALEVAPIRLVGEVLEAHVDQEGLHGEALVPGLARGALEDLLGEHEGLEVEAPDLPAGDRVHQAREAGRQPGVLHQGRAGAQGRRPRDAKLPVRAHPYAACPGLLSVVSPRDRDRRQKGISRHGTTAGRRQTALHAEQSRRVHGP